MKAIKATHDGRIVKLRAEVKTCFDGHDNNL